MRLDKEEITVVRAGIFTPAARVSVAKTTLTKPRVNNSSTNPFHAGKTPAWWAAIPRLKGST